MTTDSIRLDEALTWLRHVESMHEDTARRKLRSRMRDDVTRARAEVQLPAPWPSMPEVVRRMFERGGELVRLHRIVDIVPTGARVLDVGCGPGVVGGTLALHDRPGAYLGLDLNEARIASARSMAESNGLIDRLRFEVGDAAALPEETITNLAPDTVLIFEVLEHLIQPSTVLKSIADLVADDTRIIFSVPILGRIEACWGHRTLFGADAIIGLAESCDLQLLDVEEIHNTWAMATTCKRRAEPSTRTGTSPVTIERLAPQAIATDVAAREPLSPPSVFAASVGPGETVRPETETPNADWVRLDVGVEPPTALSSIEVASLDADGSVIRRWDLDITRLRETGRRTFIARPQEATWEENSSTAARTQISLTASASNAAEVTLWRIDHAVGYRRLLPPTPNSPRTEDQPLNSPMHASAQVSESNPPTRVRDTQTKLQTSSRFRLFRHPGVRQKVRAAGHQYRAAKRRLGGRS